MNCFRILVTQSGSNLGVLDLDEKFSPSFRRENDIYRFGEMISSRSFEFFIPDTTTNRSILGFSNDPNEYGISMRKRYEAQFQYSGGVLPCLISVNSFSDKKFRCVLYFFLSNCFQKIANKKLKDITVDGFTTAWGGPIAANERNINEMPAAVVAYDGTYNENAHIVSGEYWRPSISLRQYVSSVLSNLGITCVSEIKSKHRLIAGSMRGGGVATGIITKQDLLSGSIIGHISDFIEFDTDARLYYRGLFGLPVYTECWSFHVKYDCFVKFPSDFPTNHELISINGTKVSFLGDYYIDAMGVHGQPLAGRQVQLFSGQEFFIVKERGGGTDESYSSGWKRDASPFTFDLEITFADNIEQGQIWDINVNQPDITVSELVRSSAMVDGLDVYVSEEEGQEILHIGHASIGDFIVSFDKVINVKNISRNVSEWGANTRRVDLGFESADYVKNSLLDSYEIENENLGDVKFFIVNFNEGSSSSNSTGWVWIDDVEIDGRDAKLKGETWTIADTDEGGSSVRMLRVSFAGYDTASYITKASTCVELSVLYELHDFFTLDRGAIIYWNGSRYLWTSAEWSEGVMEIVLQQM